MLFPLARELSRRIGADCEFIAEERIWEDLATFRAIKRIEKNYGFNDGALTTAIQLGCAHIEILCEMIGVCLAEERKRIQTRIEPNETSIDALSRLGQIKKRLDEAE